MTLLESIRLEFAVRGCGELCLEDFGVIPGLPAFIEDIKLKVEPELAISPVYYGEISITNSHDCFPDVLHLSIDYNGKRSSQNRARYTDIKATHNGLEVWISAELYGDYSHVFDEFPSVLAHEIMHAYEDYNRRFDDIDASTLKDASTDLDTIIDSSQFSLDNNLPLLYAPCAYIVSHSDRFHDVLVNFAKCYYWLSPLERNANLGRLEIELKDDMKKIYGERSALKYITGTNLYNELESVRKSLSDIQGKHKEISLEINDRFAEKGIVTTPKQIRRTIAHLNDAFRETERKFNNNAANLAARSVVECGNFWYD